MSQSGCIYTRSHAFCGVATRPCMHCRSSIGYEAEELDCVSQLTPISLIRPVRGKEIFWYSISVLSVACTIFVNFIKFYICFFEYVTSIKQKYRIDIELHNTIQKQLYKKIMPYIIFFITAT